MSSDGETFGLTPVVKVRTHQEVLHKLQEAIFDGTLKPGDRLPGERQLSETLGVSRASVREALRILEALDVLSARTGSGRQSGSIIEAAPDDALPNLLALYVALNHFSMRDVIEVRQVIERWAASRTAEHATEGDLAEAERLLDAMDNEGLTREEFRELDTQFHIAIVGGAGNPLLSYLMRSLRTALERRMLEAFEAESDWPTLAKQLRQEHREVYRALADRDPEKADRCVTEHLTGFYDRLEAS